MMSVREYAIDVDKSIDYLLNLCQKLEIDVKNKEDMLDDEAIIMLDNEIANYEDFAEESEDIDIEEEVAQIEEYNQENKKSTSSNTNNKNKKKQVKQNKQELKKKKDFQSKRKEMYKHKEKLQSNTVETTNNIIAYTEGMSVSDLASSINIPATEIIKKLMSLGMMMTMNSVLDFDTAEIIASEYKKTLKKNHL